MIWIYGYPRTPDTGLQWPVVRITLRQGARIVYETVQNAVRH
jgi:hypothetical protein